MIEVNEREESVVGIVVLIIICTLVLAFSFAPQAKELRRQAMRAVGVEPEFSRDLYYLNENIEFSEAEKSVKDKINLKAYWVRKEVAGDYNKYKDSAELITESNGFLLFNPIVEDEPFKVSLSKTNSNIERSCNSELAGNELDIRKHPALPRFNAAYLTTDSNSIKSIKNYSYKAKEKPLGDIDSVNTKLAIMEVIPEYLGGVDNSYNNVYVTQECKDAFDEVYKNMINKARIYSGSNYKIKIEVKAWFNGKDDEDPAITSAGNDYTTVARDRAMIPYKFHVGISSANGDVNDECTIYNTSEKFKLNYNTGVAE